MSQAAALYSPEVLGLATALAAFPLSDDLPLRGSARAPVCGSTIELGMELDSEGRIERLGLKAHACAIGQATAALFARSAAGQDRGSIAATLEHLTSWLDDPAAALPNWPGIEAIAAARASAVRWSSVTIPSKWSISCWAQMARNPVSFWAWVDPSVICHCKINSLWRITLAVTPGIDRHPSAPKAIWGERHRISGLMNTSGTGSPDFHAASITNTRAITPIWGAARPRPFASYIVSSISRASVSVFDNDRSACWCCV